MPQGKMLSQRKRGLSFRNLYTDCVNGTALSIDAEGSDNSASTSFRRSPTLTAVSNSQGIIPPKSKELEDRLTVVFDLDETLVYAREGPLYVRPGIEALMQFLAEKCETIVWTSSMHRYADAVVDEIDRFGAVKHVVYRHPCWFHGTSATKELKLLGRDLNSTIIIENTPDCMRGYESNGVLVEDYLGGELEDTTLFTILALLKDLVHRRATEHVTVPEYLNAAPCISRKTVPMDQGTPLECYCLVQADSLTESAFPPSSPNSLMRSLRQSYSGGVPAKGSLVARRPKREPRKVLLH